MPGLTRKQKATIELAAKGKEPHSIPDAVKLLKTFPPSKFDQTVEVAIHLSIDPRQAEQQLRGAVSMPNGVGKSAKVICFCPSDKVDAAKAAGAIEAGADDLIKKVDEIFRWRFP